jgi:hypothetical protein
MTYIGCFASAVIGLFLRSALRGRVPEDTIFSIQIALFVVGGAVGAFLDVRQSLRKKKSQ